MFYLSQPVGDDGWAENGVTVNQLFGENAVPFYAQLGLKGHNGIDFRTQYYQNGHAPIYAAHDGWVISDKTIQSDSKGRFVEIMSDEVEIDGKKCKVKTVYFHLSEARVSITDDIQKPWYDISRYWGKSGRWVPRGLVLIGTGGNTGQYTTGPHLHFGMYIYWKQGDGTFKKDSANGYDGAVDPMPYFKDDTLYWTGGDYFYNGKRMSTSDGDKLKIPKFS